MWLFYFCFLICFNPSYSFNVQTNTGKVFVKLVRKHLPRSHKFNKIFHLNTIKICYSLMANLKNLIKQNNLKILGRDQGKIQQSCKCRMKKTCPLNGERLRQRMVYMAEVTTNTIYKEDYGAPDGEFKSRYNNDIQSFRDISHNNDME